MHHCAICGKALPNPIDEYGSLTAPLCQSCWLGDLMPGEFPTAQEAQREFEELIEDELP